MPQRYSGFMKADLRFAIAGVATLLLLVGAAATQKRDHYDDQIREEVRQVLAQNSDYRNVTATVEDSVVTLSGDVHLDSTREALISRVRRIPHIESVESNIVLSPPAVPDPELWGRVQRALADAGFGEITVRVHEGAVRLEGTVRNAKDRQRAIELARQTEGVKEVQASLLSVAE